MILDKCHIQKSGQWAFSFPWASSSSHQPNHRDDLGEDSLAIRPVFLFSLPLHPPSLFNPPPLLLVHRLIYRTRVKTIATHGGGWEFKWGVGFIGITAFSISFLDCVKVETSDAKAGDDKQPSLSLMVVSLRTSPDVQWPLISKRLNVRFLCVCIERSTQNKRSDAKMEAMNY